MTPFRSRPSISRTTGALKHLGLLALALALSVPLRALAAGPASINLGTAARFLVLSGAAITSTGGGTIDGDVGASPIAGSAIGLDPAQVSGTIFTVDSGGPAGSVIDSDLLTAATADFHDAFVDAANRIPVPVDDFLNPGEGNLGGLTLVPGLYKFTSTALLTGADLTLTGGPDDVWIFQIGSELIVGTGIKVLLAGGARPGNIFWQVSSSATIGTFAEFKGTILADQAITLDTSCILEGRALAYIAGITFNGVSISLPGLVGDRVWYDANLNGFQDSEETGLPNVAVDLFDGSSNLVDTVTTDSDGLFSFTNTSPGTYFLQFTRPEWYQFTLENLHPFQGSQADRVTGRTAVFSVFAGEYKTGQDAGLIATNPALQVVKLAGDASDGAVLHVLQGSDVTYHYWVINAGTTFMTNVVVSDDVLGLVDTIHVMAPGRVVHLTAVHSNILADVVNVATARGTPVYANGDSIADLVVVSTTDVADTRVDAVPLAPPTLSKSVSVNPAIPGQLLVFTISVSNASLSGVVSNVSVLESYDPLFKYKYSSLAPRAGTSNVWDLGDLPPGFSTNIVITGKLAKRAIPGSHLTNTSVVFSDAGSRSVTLDVGVVVGLPVPVTLLAFSAVTVQSGVKVKWSTATEFDNLGFNLYRSTSEGGLRRKVNERLIPGSQSLQGARYTVVDRRAKPGDTLYYWLEEVAVNFKTVYYGPAIRLASAASDPSGIPLVLGRFRTESTGGLYRVRYETLAAAGFPPAALASDRLGIRIRGAPVAVHVSAPGATLQPGDSLLFYARKSDGGVPCSMTLESCPRRMSQAIVLPIHGPGAVYLDGAGAS